MSAKHELKCWPGPFQEVWLGLKTFEVRKDDRNYQVGDGVKLKEFVPGAWNGEYTGREIWNLRITSKLVGGQFGIEPGYCVLSLSEGRDCRDYSKRTGAAQD